MSLNRNFTNYLCTGLDESDIINIKWLLDMKYICGSRLCPQTTLSQQDIMMNCLESSMFYLFIWGFTSLSTLYRSYHDG